MSSQPISLVPPYRVFMSHAGPDRTWVQWLAAHAGQIGIDVYLFEHDPQPGNYISDKVQHQINLCDVVVVLLTTNSAQSAYVHQEIGFAEAHHKLIIPLVQPGIDNRHLAMLAGREYIPFDFQDPRAGLESFLGSLYRLKVFKQAMAEQQQTANRNLALLGLGGLFLLALTSKE
jgi:hypothetical protein